MIGQTFLDEHNIHRFMVLYYSICLAKNMWVEMAQLYGVIGRTFWAEQIHTIHGNE